MRALLIAVVVVVVGTSGTAEARRGGGGIVVINTGDDIEPIRDLPADVATALGYGKLGYRYERFGLFWMDLWRWDGEFVVYSGNTYVSLDDEQLAYLGGGSVPWRYHLPDGLLIVIAGLYLGFIGRRRRKVKTTLYIAGALLVTSIAFFFMGLSWEFGIPLVIALHHGIAARAAMKAGDDEPSADDDDVSARDDDAAPARPSRPTGPRPSTDGGRVIPNATADTQRSQPVADTRPSQPVVIAPTPAAPAAVPMRTDDRVEGPKLLR